MFFFFRSDFCVIQRDDQVSVSNYAARTMLVIMLISLSPNTRGSGGYAAVKNGMPSVRRGSEGGCIHCKNSRVYERDFID